MEQMVDEMCGRSVDNFALEQVIGVGRTSTCPKDRYGSAADLAKQLREIQKSLN